MPRVLRSSTRATAPPTKRVKKKPMTISERNLIESPFLKLPSELRNKIYDYAFPRQTWRVPRSGPAIGSASIPLALLSVCRQIHAEARLIPWTRDSFQITELALLRHWLTSYPRDFRKAITFVNLIFNHKYGYSSYMVSQPAWWKERNLLLFDFPKLKQVEVCVQVDYNRCYVRDHTEIEWLCEEVKDFIQKKKPGMLVSVGWRLEDETGQNEI